MEIEDSLRRFAAILDASGIPYAICGSIASSHFGKLRTTHDVDLVLQCDRDGLFRLLRNLGTTYYASEAAAFDAFNRRSMFNVIEFESGLKFDLIFPKGDDFDHSAFQRRRQVNLAGTSLSVLSAEDVVLSKLMWHTISQSQRQLDDIRGILAMQGDRLDDEYLNLWADELGVAETLAACRASAI